MRQTEQLVFIKEHRMGDDLIYVLQDSCGQKRLVDGKPYKQFRLQPGMPVVAIVRGRDCAGEEIAELQHPVFKIGCLYEMTIVEAKKIQINDVSTCLVIVEDGDENTYRIKVDDLSKYCNQQKVWCKLIEQKKGKLIFTIENG
jgi:hypothetical protein